MDAPQNKPTLTSSQRQESRVLTIVSLWSVGLFLTFVLVVGFVLVVAPYALIVIFPNGRFMAYLFSAVPLLLISMWCVGIVLAYRRHRSWHIVLGLLLSGFVVVSTFPIWFYLTVILFVGGWDVGK